VGAFISSLFGAIGGDLGHSLSHSWQSTPPIYYIGVAIMIASFGLILYKVVDELGSKKKKKSDTRELAKEIRKQQQEEELDQIDKQDRERNEGSDRYTPANIK
jgi:uncharacterized membrane protein (DUF106 family)